MSANSLIEVVQEAVDSTGRTDVPVEDRTKPLLDNGVGYVSSGPISLIDNIGMVTIKYIVRSHLLDLCNTKPALIGELGPAVVASGIESADGEILSGLLIQFYQLRNWGWVRLFSPVNSF